MPSWSAELTWCGSELYLLGCSVPRGGLEIAAVDGACSLGTFSRRRGVNGPPAQYLQCGWRRKTPTWSPYATAWAVTHGVLPFSRPRASPPSPVPPAGLCGRLLYCFWIFPLHFIEESQERGVFTVSPPRLLSEPIAVASPGVLVDGWPASHSTGRSSSVSTDP